MAYNSLGLRNLTDDDIALLATVGITTREQFDRMGGDKAYQLIVATDATTDDDLLYRLRGAERDMDWHILAERDQQRTKSRFVDVDEP